MPIAQTKTVALFAAKLGYQTRSFESAARKLNVQLAYVTDRCHELADPWNDQRHRRALRKSRRSRRHSDAISARQTARTQFSLWATRLP